MAWMLFLNKTDLLTEKIKTKPLNLSFKDYPSDSAFPTLSLLLTLILTRARTLNPALTLT